MKYKKQHYVTRSYLRGFTEGYNSVSDEESERIWVYDKETYQCFDKSIQNVATRSHYYSFVSNGKYNPSLEQQFGKIETKGVEAIREVEKAVNAFKKDRIFSLDQDIHTALVDFAYLHSMRVPAVVDLLREKTAVYEQEIANELKIDPSPERVTNMALTVLVKLLGTTDFPIYDSFFKRKLFVLYTRKSVAQILTSDNPVIRFNKTGNDGVGEEKTEIWLPLSQTILLAFMNGGHTDYRIDHFNEVEEIMKINCFMASKATKYVFGHSPRFLAQVAERNGWKFELKKPEQRR